MEAISLQFPTLELLIAFLKQSGNLRCTIDLAELTLASTFSEQDIEQACCRFYADTLVESSVY